MNGISILMGKGSRKNHSDISWREFEKEVEVWIEEKVNPDEYRVEHQKSSVYSDGETKRMDIHVAERRQGGSHHVIDAKHFTGDLPVKEIKDAFEYKKRSRSSSITVVVSDTTTIPENTQRIAKNMGVDIVRKRGKGAINRVKEVFDNQPEYFD